MAWSKEDFKHYGPPARELKELISGVPAIHIPEIKGRIKCFVIMPFSETTKEHTEEYWTKHFEDFLKPVIEETKNVEVSRSEALRGDLLNQIIYNLVTADIIVADLTDSNPNVFWELGIRHSYENGTITIMDDGYRLPFDLSKIGTLKYYPKNHLKNEGFKAHLKKAVLDCINFPDKIDSYVLEMMSGRGSIYEIINEQENKRRIEGLLAELSYNKDIIDSIYADIKNNADIRKRMEKEPDNREELRKEIGFTTQLLRNSSIENLLVNRYLDCELDVYKNIEIVRSRIDAFNQFNGIWVDDQEYAESWYMRTKNDMIKGVGAYEKVIDQIYEKYAEVKRMAGVSRTGRTREIVDRDETKRARMSALSSKSSDKIAVNPQRASVGDPVSVHSNSHTAGTVVQIYFDFVQPGSLLSEGVAGPDGVSVQFVTIPETEIGIHYFWIKDMATGISNMAHIEII